MKTLFQDLMYGARLLWKDKGFAVTAIATLTLCIGANTTIFSVLHSVVLRPLPIEESSRVLLMYNSYPGAGAERAATGVPDYYDRLRGMDVFEEQTLFDPQGLTIGEPGSVMRVAGMGVTPSLFRLLRAEPLLGRIFTEEEGELGSERKVIISHQLWQDRFGGESAVLGRDLRIYGNPYTIVGVMGPDFAFLDSGVMLWRPLAFTDQQKQAYHSNNWEMIGRLKPGASLAQAQAQIDAINAANMERFPEFKEVLINAGFHTRVVPLQDELIREVRGTLYLLWGGVLCVLVIGVVNIANLVLARSSTRMKEVATRMALGAGPGRVARQLLTENMLITAIGSAAGFILGYWGLRVLEILQLDQISRGSEISLDATVVGFIALLTLVVSVMIGIIPVARGLNLNVSSVLHQEGRTVAGGRGARVARNSLVVAQVALCLILLIGGGLLLSSFQNVLAIDPGFDPRNVLTGSVVLPSSRYPDGERRQAFREEVLERLRSLPGVESAAITNIIPFGYRFSDSVIFAEGYRMEPGESPVSPNMIQITPGYLETMRIPLIEGRFFDGRDRADSEKVIIIDEGIAGKFFPGRSPIGRRMWQPGSIEGDLTQPNEDSIFYTIVGVVGKTKLRGLVFRDERLGAYYFPYAQTEDSDVTFALRTAVEPMSLVSALRRTLGEVDPALPLYDVRLMEDRIDESLVSRRSPMILALGFGLVALFLAAVGIYGVLAYLVAQRTREIGIRIALGSGSEQVFSMILKEGAWIIGIGILLGFGGVLALARYIGSLLFGIKPLDPTILVTVAAGLAIISILACLLPARRATRIDPILALRQE
jgi:predicted permease